MIKIFKIISSFVFIVVFLTSCSQLSQENIKIVKTNYDIERCKKETYIKEDLKQYEELINSGEIQGYNCAGIYYIKTTKDYEKAEEYFKKGIKAGSVESYYQLGSLYSAFMKKDSKYVIREYEKAALKGHTLAMHNLGVQYFNQGKFDEAIKWYRKSANSGDNYSLEGLGHTYRMKGDLEKARDTYLELAQRKDPQGYKNLGIFYSKEENYKDLKKSKEYFLKCIEFGDNDCYTALAAAIYEKEKDYGNAIKWYKKGFEVGTKSSVNRLGFLYTDILKDYDNAIYWYKKGYKELDCIDCAFLLAYLYEEDLKNYDEAIYWYKIGHSRGDYSSTQNLGYLYEKYLKDYKNAEIWYKKALKTKNHKKAKRGLQRLKKLGVLGE